MRSSLPARLSDLRLAIERLSRELENLRRRRQLLGSVSLEPKLTKRIRPVDPKARIQNALAVSGQARGQWDYGLTEPMNDN